MLKPVTLVRMFAELAMLLLGLLLVRLAYTGRLLWDRRSPMWIGLGFFLVYWGLRAWLRAGKQELASEERLRGASLALVGAVMLGIVKAPFHWVMPMLAIAGVILALRGLASFILAGRAR